VIELYGGSHEGQRFYIGYVCYHQGQILSLFI